MKEEQLMLVGKVIEFPKKKQEDKNKKFFRNKEIKDSINMLLDNYEGDFCIVFESKGVADIFEENLKTDVLVVSTNKNEANRIMSNYKTRSHFIL